MDTMGLRTIGLPMPITGLMAFMGGPGEGITGAAAIGNENKKPGTRAGLFVAPNNLLERTSLTRLRGVAHCRCKIFLALSPEFFLRSFETRDPRGDFFALGTGVVWLFGHAYPF
jgi:hypothetical protein